MHLPSRVPLLPGHIYSDPHKTEFHKKQMFSVKDGTMCEDKCNQKEAIDIDLIDTLLTQCPPPPTETRDPPENDYIPRIQAPWIKYDRKVLKFNAYFQEAVVESRLENCRTRECNIFYYLNDGTIHVTEPKVENSGIPQGYFIKRQLIYKDRDQNIPFTWQDFNVGQNITFFERTYRIVDCDDFTKFFLSDQGVQLGKPENIEVDAFGHYTKLKEQKIPPPDYKEYKEYYEVKLGGGHPNGGLDLYLTNDRKVLSFDIMWNDTTLCGGINFYKMNYFLADNTVEVKEVRKQNNGKDPFPLLLQRQK